jgi:hypothetical protein
VVGRRLQQYRGDRIKLLAMDPRPRQGVRLRLLLIPNYLRRMQSPGLAVAKPGRAGGGTATPDSEQTDSNETAELRQQVQAFPYGAAMSGIVGGFVRGFVTVFGVSVATPRFRRPEAWMTTISIATLLGILLETVRLGEIMGFLALFTIWQAAVIAFIDRGMALGAEGPGL